MRGRMSDEALKTFLLKHLRRSGEDWTVPDLAMICRRTHGAVLGALYGLLGEKRVKRVECPWAKAKGRQLFLWRAP